MSDEQGDRWQPQSSVYARPRRRYPARSRRRPRVYLRGGIGCIGCSVPLLAALAAVITAVILAA